MDTKRNISTEVFDELAQKDAPVILPVLVDIKHPGIKWNYSSDAGDKIQTNGHLRLINDTQGVKYKGSDNQPFYYAPCKFSYKPPKEDGKSKSKATISISCIDSRVVEVIRSITEGVTCRVVAMFGKSVNEEGRNIFSFSRLNGKEFEMGECTWDSLTAQWTLDPDSIMDISAPKVVADMFNFNSIVSQ